MSNPELLKKKFMFQAYFLSHEERKRRMRSGQEAGDIAFILQRRQCGEGQLLLAIHNACVMVLVDSGGRASRVWLGHLHSPGVCSPNPAQDR